MKRLLLIAPLAVTAASIALALTGAAAGFRPFNWVEAKLKSAPAGRCCAGIAFDPSMRATLFFGGFGNPQVYNDTWIWQKGWHQLSPPNAPSPRSGQAMVWDGAAGNILLFGGTESGGTFVNETWTWDGTTWTQQFPPVPPSPRRFDTTTGMAYDAATGTVVLFGGLVANGVVIGDTWIWDGKAKTWTQQFPGNSPSPRRTMLVYDESAHNVVLFGGDNATGLGNTDTYYNDTWVWDGANWTQQFPAPAPSPRAMSALAYDRSRGVIVLFSGQADGPLTDTWVWGSKTWTEIHPKSAPVSRWATNFAYDPYAAGLLLFGGFGTQTLTDTWLLAPARPADGFTH
jgi:hypothetical protein